MIDGYKVLVTCSMINDHFMIILFFFQSVSCMSYDPLVPARFIIGTDQGRQTFFVEGFVIKLFS